ncbi:P-loop containing nucleoside triphosphate hydrolase protein [Chytridium lagenaria]|nr:P-loop containing nucleoside triphosphate hydrolase protein [Chytridium lagenaria]
MSQEQLVNSVIQLDPLKILKEREDKIRHSINSRIKYLESLPSNLSNDQVLPGNGTPKLVPHRVKNRCGWSYEVHVQDYDPSNRLDRTPFKRARKVQLREFSQTEKIEKDLRSEREKRERQKLIDYCNQIISHGRDMSRASKLGTLVMKFHTTAERDEQKRASKLSQERLNALPVDQAKDTRITQILSQTSGYLANLSAAVVTQQDSVAIDASMAVQEEENGEATAKADYYNVAHKIKEEVTEQSALLVGGKLKEYQIKGLQWMISLYNNRLNGILADEMGLGKTIQTISLITSSTPLPSYCSVGGQSTNWQLEFEKWATFGPQDCVQRTAGRAKTYGREIRSGNFNVIITTYEYIIKEKALLSKIKWVYMIIDEGHRMKNSNSKLSVTLMQYYFTRYRLILTGTPLKERLLMVKGLHKALRPFLLRRLKKDVESELPDKVEIIVKCAMSSLQRKITERVKILRNIGPFDINSTCMNNLVMQLRKICNHPFVFPEVEELFCSGETMTNDLIFRTSGKFELLDRILPKFFKTGHRVLMFFQMTQIMDIMEDYLRYRGWNFLRLDGHIKSEDRGDLLKEFNAKTATGGLGLNLQTADTVVIFDSDWNPHQDLQAQDRAHRIGQTKEVRIVRLITTNSIEEHILSKAQQKLNLDEKVIQAGKFDQKTSEKEREELLRLLFEKEETKEETEEDAEFTDEQLNEMLARGPDEVEIFNQMDLERTALEKKHHAKEWTRLISVDELPDFYQVDLETLREEEKDELLSTKTSRERKSVRYDDNLTEEQWLDALEEGDIEGAIQKKQLRRASRGKGASGNNDDDADSDTGEADPASAMDVDDDDDAGGRKAKRKGRKASNAVDEDTPEGEDGGEGKKKTRKPKAVRKPRVDKKKDESNDPLKPGQRAALSRIFDSVLDAMRNLAVKEDDGVTRYQVTLFETLPSKRAYRDYYTLIKTPIALDTVEKRCDTSYYNSVADFKADLLLMFENARTYNEETSQIVMDAAALQRLVSEKLDELAPGGDYVPDPEEEEAQDTASRKRGASEMEDDEEEQPVQQRTVTIKIPPRPKPSGFKINLPKRPRVEKEHETEESEPPTSDEEDASD